MAAGDRAIYKDATGGADVIKTPFTVALDTTVPGSETVGGAFSRSGGVVTFTEAGAVDVPVLVLANAGVTEVGNVERTMTEMWVDVNGSPSAYAWGACYTRSESSSEPGHPFAAGVLLLSDGDTLELKLHEISDNTVLAGELTTVAGESALQLIRLDDTWDYFVAHRTSDFTYATAWTAINYASASTTLRHDAGFGTLTASGLNITATSDYLVCATASHEFVNPTTTGTLYIAGGRLTYGGFELPGTRSDSHVRQAQGCNLASGCQFWAGTLTAGSALAVELRDTESRGNFSSTQAIANRTALSVIKLPANALQLILDDDDYSTASQPADALTEYELLWRGADPLVDAPTFSHTADTSVVTINKTGDFLFGCGTRVRSPGGGVNTRIMPRLKWLYNGSEVGEGRTSYYSRGRRNGQNFGEAGHSIGLLLTDASATDNIRVNSNNVTTLTAVQRDFDNDDAGLPADYSPIYLWGLSLSDLFPSGQVNLVARSESYAAETSAAELTQEISGRTESVASGSHPLEALRDVSGRSEGESPPIEFARLRNYPGLKALDVGRASIAESRLDNIVDLIATALGVSTEQATKELTLAMQAEAIGAASTTLIGATFVELMATAEGRSVQAATLARLVGLLGDTPVDGTASKALQSMLSDLIARTSARASDVATAETLIDIVADTSGEAPPAESLVEQTAVTINFLQDNGTRSTVAPTGKMAPSMISVDCYATSLSAGELRRAKIVWDFGDTTSPITIDSDPDPFGYRTGTPSAVTGQRGISAAYVYQTDGAYTVRCTITQEDGTILTGDTQITIAADTRTPKYVDSLSGSDAATGDNGDPWQTLGYALTTGLTSDMAINLTPGQTFQVVGNTSIVGVTNVLIRRNGAGANPIIESTANGLSIQSMISLDAACIDWGIQDVTIKSLAPYATTTLASAIGTSGRNLWLLDCVFDGDETNAFGNWIVATLGSGLCLINVRRGGSGAHSGRSFIECNGHDYVTLLGVELDSARTDAQIRYYGGAEYAAIGWSDANNQYALDGDYGFEYTEVSKVSIFDSYLRTSLKLGDGGQGYAAALDDMQIDATYVEHVRGAGAGIDNGAALAIGDGIDRVYARNSIFWEEGSDTAPVPVVSTAKMNLNFVQDDGTRSTSIPTGREAPAILVADIYDVSVAGDIRKAKIQWDFGDTSYTADVTDPDAQAYGLGQRSGLRDLNVGQEGLCAAFVYDTPGDYTVTCTVTEESGSQQIFTDSFTVVASSRVVRYVDSGAGGANDGTSEANAWLSIESAMAVLSSDMEIRIQDGDLQTLTTARSYNGLTNVLFRPFTQGTVNYPRIESPDAAFTWLTTDSGCGRWGFDGLTFESLSSFSAGNKTDFLVANGSNNVWVRGGTLRGESGTAHAGNLKAWSTFLTLNNTAGIAVIRQTRNSQELNGKGAHVEDYYLQATGAVDTCLIGAQLNSANDLGHVFLKDSCIGAAFQWFDVYSDPDVGGYNSGVPNTVEIYSAQYVSIIDSVLLGSIRCGYNDGAVAGKAEDVLIDRCYIRKVDETSGTEVVGAIDINAGADRILVRNSVLESRGSLTDFAPTGLASNPSVCVGSSGTSTPSNTASNVDFYNCTIFTPSRTGATNPAHTRLIQVNIAGITYSNISFRNCLLAAPGTEYGAVDLIYADPTMFANMRNNLWAYRDRYRDFLNSNNSPIYTSFDEFKAANDSLNSAEGTISDTDSESISLGNKSYAPNDEGVDLAIPIDGVHHDYTGVARDTMAATWDVGAGTVSTAVGLEFFEKLGGALDKMGVRVEAVLPAQKVWAPGTGEAPMNEYPGGWVTPGDYDLSLVAAKLHHWRDGRAKGTGTFTGGVTLPLSVGDDDQNNPGPDTDLPPQEYALCYYITNEAITFGGYEWRDSLSQWDEMNEGQLRPIHPTLSEIATSVKTEGPTKRVTLAAGDVLHVAFGRPMQAGGGRNNHGHHQGSDGIVVYCVATLPEYRGGLYGTGKQTYDANIWSTFVSRVNAAADVYSLTGTPYNATGTGELSITHYGPAVIPDPIPDDWMNRGNPAEGGPVGFTGGDDTFKNSQWKWVSRFIMNRAFDIIKNGAGAQSTTADLDRLVRFILNNVQPTFYFTESAWNYCHMGHGFDPWPPYQTAYLQAILAGVVAVGLTPDYEPLHRWLTYFAQQIDSNVPRGDSYLHGNTNNVSVLSAYADNYVIANPPGRRHAYVNWIVEDAEHIAGGANAPLMNGDRDRQACPWAMGLWARRLLGISDTQAITDMLTTQGSPGGHQFSSTGATDWDNPHTKHNVSAMHWLWFTDTEKNRDMSRFCRRDPRYYHNPKFGTPGAGTIPANHGLPSFFGTEQKVPFWAAEDKRQFYWSLWVQDTFVFDPTGLSAVAGVGDIDLDWDDYSVAMASASSSFTHADGGGNGYASDGSAPRYDLDFDSFNVYRATVSGGPYTQIATSVAVSAFSDTTGTPATTYYYVVTAVDTDGNESAYSDEVSAVFP